MSWSLFVQLIILIPEVGVVVAIVGMLLIRETYDQKDED